MNADRQIRRAAELQQQTRAQVAGFLRVEVDVSLTFVEAALNANGSQKRVRYQTAARKGYDTILRYFGKYGSMCGPDFMETLDRLKTALEALGETDLQDYRDLNQQP